MRNLPATWERLRRRHAEARGTSCARWHDGARGSIRVDPLESAKLAGFGHVNDGEDGGHMTSRAAESVALCRCTPSRRIALSPPYSSARHSAGMDRCLDLVSIRAAIFRHGRDARRKQYRYHANGATSAMKRATDGCDCVCRALLASDSDRADLKRPVAAEKVLAAVAVAREDVIRVATRDARDNGSIGLTTMREKHTTIQGANVRFEFRGKSGIEHAVDLRDARLARIVKACRDLPGYELFQYVDESGERRVVDSADVNSYLREISGEDFTAKDFRTWAGTVLAAGALAQVEKFTSTAHAKRNIVRAVESVAKRLGNTTAVCRKCYIHPAIPDAYLDGATVATVKARAVRMASQGPGLSAVEAAVVGLIDQQLHQKIA